MSDRDTTHLLEELQRARSLADSHERAFRQANARCVELMAEVERGRDMLGHCLPYIWREYLLGNGGEDAKKLIDLVTGALQSDQTPGEAGNV